MVQRKLLFAVACCALGSCGGSTPSAPDATAVAIVVTGAEVLRITFQSSCPGLGQGVLPLVYTRVNVALTSSDWVASASSPAGGDVELHIRQSGPAAPGIVPVTGTISGTAIHMPDLFPQASWNLSVSFSGQTLLTGTAFAAGAVPNTTTGGMDGLGNGTVTLTAASGASCSGAVFSWSIYPPS